MTGFFRDGAARATGPNAAPAPRSSPGRVTNRRELRKRKPGDAVMAPPGNQDDRRP